LSSETSSNCALDCLNLSDERSTQREYVVVKQRPRISEDAVLALLALLALLDAFDAIGSEWNNRA